MAALSGTGSRVPPMFPVSWIGANLLAGAVSGLFFGNWPVGVPSAIGGDRAMGGGLLLAVVLFGPFAATGLAFMSAQWLLLRERTRLSGAWLAIAPLAGLAFMVAQHLITIWTEWLIGGIAILLAAAVAGWIIGAVQWLLMKDPDFSANWWVAATATGAVAAVLIWYPTLPWAVTHLSAVVAGALAGGLYGIPQAAFFALRNVRRSQRVLTG